MCTRQAGNDFFRGVSASFHKVREGRNGGGDPWPTDGNGWVQVIAVPGSR
jgi:hypothetical protein